MALNHTHDRYGQPFSVTVRVVTHGIAIVNVTGELDIATGPQCRQAINEQIRHGMSIVVDLSRCGFIGSMGLDVLLEAHTQAQAAGLRVTLSGPVESVARVLRVSGIGSELNIHPSMLDAVRALSEPASPTG